MDEDVLKMTQVYHDMIQQGGEDYVKKVLAGARASATGIMNPQHSYEALKMYQLVEKNLFGSIGKMNKGEQDLTKES